MAPPDMTALSLQPWARDGAEEGKLSEILARVSDERGHFRDITETSLQEEIAAEGALASSDGDSEDESEEDDNDDEKRQTARAKPTSREELFKAKFEMLAHVRAAEQEILMSLDFVSLLLSKDAPRQAQSTISPVLKDAAPLGTLGTDIWQRMPVDHAREVQDELLATNVRMEGLQRSADGLLAAASRLETNVRKETRYWEQILSISDAGWSVCRIGGERHRLGVNFGFNESAPQFSRRGLAAFNADSDGDITLERGVGTKPLALRATLRKAGQIVGTSSLPNILDADESTLEARLRYARDSLFDEELYHEMIRESRNLTSLGVSMKGSTIQIASGSADSELLLHFDLLSLDGDHRIDGESSTKYNDFAQAIILAAKLLLGQAHRERLKKRSQIPAPVASKTEDERPVLPILRPLMSFLIHKTALSQLNALLLKAEDILDLAQIQSTQEIAKLMLPLEAEITSSESLVSRFMLPWVSEGSITIAKPSLDELKLAFQIRTTLAQGFGARFTLTTPLSSTTTYHVDDISELPSAIEAKLAAMLARALAEALDDRWKCNENEALIVRDVGIGEKQESIWVAVDIETETLSLRSLAKKITWRTGESKTEMGFWDAKDGLL